MTQLHLCCSDNLSVVGKLQDAICAMSATRPALKDSFDLAIVGSSVDLRAVWHNSYVFIVEAHAGDCSGMFWMWS